MISQPHKQIQLRVKAQQTLKAPGVIKETLLWPNDSDLSDGKVPKALSDRNLSLFLSRLMAEASQGNSLGRSDRPARSHSTLQLLSCVQEQEGGQALTQAQRAMTPWGSSHSSDTGKRTGNQSVSQPWPTFSSCSARRCLV